MRPVPLARRAVVRLLAGVTPVLTLPSLLGACSAAPVVLGIRPSGAPAAIASISQAAAKSPVVVSGEMIEKCPVAGCWFVLRDRTGQVRVDTKAAGFVVTSVPLNTTITVAGSVQREDGLTTIAARGARY